MVLEEPTMANHQRNPAKEQFWRQALARQRASGLSIRAFCEREGLSEASYYQWRRELARRDRSPRQALRPGRAFVPVRIIPDADRRHARGLIEIVLAGGRRIRVGEGFVPQTLAEVVAVLEAK
jgi:transposase